MKKRLGIWIDREEAHVITYRNQQWHMETVNSEIDHFNIRGGSRSSTPYGPQDVVSEKKLLERRIHQEKNFFIRLYPMIQEADEILLFGPGEIKNKLARQISSEPRFHKILVNTETADSITKNQKVAFVREYFQ